MTESLLRWPAPLQVIVGSGFGVILNWLLVMLAVGLPTGSLALPLLAGILAASVVWKRADLPLFATGLALAAVAATLFWFYLFSTVSAGLELMG